MALTDEIAKVAYELYEKSGCQPGRDLENWLKAEKILAERSAQARKVVKTIEAPRAIERPESFGAKTAAKPAAKKTASRP